MGKITITLDDETEIEFRHIVIKLYGGQRGGLSFIGKEAIKEWIQRYNDSMGIGVVG